MRISLITTVSTYNYVLIIGWGLRRQNNKSITRLGRRETFARALMTFLELEGARLEAGAGRGSS